MRFILISLTLTIVLFGCKDANPAAATEPAVAAEAEAPAADGEEASIPEISVADAEAAIGSGAVPIDANSEKTRKKNGTVPGAVLLTSSYKYDLAQLPEDKDKDLIFYCSNTACTASDSAAERASSHGYQKVHIMREGIKGWKDAGHPTTPYGDTLPL